jgi:hypothetical protein
MKTTLNREQIEMLLSKHYIGFSNPEWCGYELTFDFEAALTKKDVQELIDEHENLVKQLDDSLAVNNWLRETLIIATKTNLVQFQQEEFDGESDQDE